MIPAGSSGSRGADSGFPPGIANGEIMNRISIVPGRFKYRILAFAVLLFILSGCSGLETDAAGTPPTPLSSAFGDEPVYALYGFSRDDYRFKDKSNQEILEILRDWKINGVFGAHRDRELAEVLRQGGIRIYAEFAVFVGEDLWKRYPDSRPVTREGKQLEKIDWYAGVNPSDEEVRRERLDAFRETITKYQLDGIWLDFIRWPGRWENPRPEWIATSFDRATVDKFSLDTGIKVDPENGPEDCARFVLEKYPGQWSDWRCRQITDWVAQARRILDNESPETSLCLFGVPWTNDFDNAVANYIGQDFQSLAPYVDIFSPMVYHLMCGRPVSWIDQVTEWFGRNTGKGVLPIIQTVDDPETLAPREFGEAVSEAVSAPGSGGAILFNLEGFDQGKLEEFQKIVGR